MSGNDHRNGLGHLIRRRLARCANLRRIGCPPWLLKYEQLSLANHRAGFKRRGKWFNARWPGIAEKAKFPRLLEDNFEEGRLHG